MSTCFHSDRPKHVAFSLVELSIVLVILGLLVGGVLSGQSLIKAAELRSVSTQYSKYVTSVNSFKDKYFALPGDMPNATSFWGTQDPTPATCATTASTTSATCNGDGDGYVMDKVDSFETLRFWQQLANAGLLEGNFSGAPDVDGGSGSINAPAGKLGNTFWGVDGSTTSVAGSARQFDGVYGRFLIYGLYYAGRPPFKGALKPEDAWNIDSKLDDGKPGTGKVVAYCISRLSSCTTTVADNGATLTADYLLSSTTQTIAFYFRQAF